MGTKLARTAYGQRRTDYAPAKAQRIMKSNTATVVALPFLYLACFDLKQPHAEQIESEHLDATESKIISSC